MRSRRLFVVLASSLLVVSCTSSGTPDDVPAAPSSGPSVPDVQAAASPDPSPSPTPTPTPEVVFGTGTVTVDGVAIPVSGDCDVSREFGEQPVTGLGDDVDVLLAVDNITGDGDHEGPFALAVRLTGTGAVEGSTITSQGAAGEDGATVDVTYEGTVDRARLRDRRSLEFVDVATLHLEAAQERSAGAAAPSDRDLVVDVVCPISRPR